MEQPDENVTSSKHHQRPNRILTFVFEFILVFLAVIGGFVFDSLREDRKDQILELQLMKSLLEDLRSDQGQFKGVRQKLAVSMRGADSLIIELNKRPLKGNEKRLYHFYNLYNTGGPPPFTDRTFIELRYSGHYNAIQNKEVVTAMIRYEKEAADSRWNGFYGAFHINNANNVVLLLSRVFDFTLANKYQSRSFENENNVSKVGFPDDIKLLSYDEQLISQLRNYISVNQADDSFGYAGNDRLEKMNHALDSLITTSYDLK